MKSIHSPNDAAALRRLAEQRPAGVPIPCGTSDTQKLLHELQVHQIELEMQNEALRDARDALEITSQRYADLYDFAPVPCVMLEQDGTVRHANHAAVALLGKNRASIVGRRLGIFFTEQSRPIFNNVLETAFQIGDKQTGEMTVLVNGQLIWVVAHAIAEATRTSCLFTLQDITERKQTELALREKELFLSESQRIAHIGSWAMAVAEESIQWSHETYRIYGLTPDTFVPTITNLLELIHPQDRAVMQQWIGACMAGQIPAALEFRVIWPDKTIRVIEGRGNLQYAPDGRPLRIVGTVQDITERRQIEESLRLIASVYTNSSEGMMVTDANGTIVTINTAFTQMTGYTSQEAVGKTPRILQSGRHDQAFYQAIWQQLLTQGMWRGEIWDRRKNGEIYPNWLNISAVKDRAGLVTHYVGLHYDISERKNSEIALLKLNQVLGQSRQQLRELAAQSEAVREEERKHIARDVHDELGQVLTALRMDISLLGMRSHPLDDELASKLLSMKALVDRAIQGVRNVATNLRPTALDMGLVPAIEWLCRDFSDRSRIPCYLNIGDKTIDLDESRCVVVFRIVQESLTNISRYAGASQVSIRIGVVDDELGVKIQDDGCGFDPASVASKKTFGMLGMRERAISLGGKVNFISSPGQGTAVALFIPIRGLRTEEPA